MSEMFSVIDVAGIAVIAFVWGYIIGVSKDD